MRLQSHFLVASFAWTCSISNAFVPNHYPVSTKCPHQNRKFRTECHGIPRVIIGAVSLFGLTTSVKVVNQMDIAVVERFGRFKTCLEPGLHFIIPMVDRVRIRLTQREQVFDIPPQKCITQDNAPLEADAVVYWRIIKPEQAFYSVVNLELAIQNLVLTQLRSEIGKLSLDETFSAREQINAVLLKDLDVSTKAWGVKITRVEVRDIIPNTEIMKAMEMQMAAERTKRAVIIKSEGERSRAINEAEGEAQSRLIDVKAEAEAIRRQAEAEAAKLELEAQGVAKSIAAIEEVLGNSEEAARFQLAREYIEAQRALATSKNAKVLLSSDSSKDILSKAMGLYEITTQK